MANQPPTQKIINLILMVIAFLIGIIYVLFLPETPTSSAPLSSQSVQIPLGSGSYSDPSQIQGGTSLNPQQAAQVKPDDLNNIGL